MSVINAKYRPYTNKLAKVINKNMDEEGINIKMLSKAVGIAAPGLKALLNYTGSNITFESVCKILDYLGLKILIVKK